MRKLKIALIGTRGVPANYGGFETCAEEVGRRLAARGHAVTVYCRKGYYSNSASTYLGMHRISLPNMNHKTLDTLSHTFLSALHAAGCDYDIFMVFNAANSLFVLPLRLLGKKIAINTDGLEWKRSKWGVWGRSFYKFSEKMAGVIANRLVSDSKGMQEYYRRRHHVDSTEIAYGAAVQYCRTTECLHGMGLEADGYFLQITRFESENHPLLTLRAFKKLNSNKKMVLVGGNPYPSAYTRAIAREADDAVLLPGFIYDPQILRELWCNAFAYIHGNSVGGTNPALLQAMAAGCFTMAIDIPFNRDVLDDCGIYYRGNEQALAAQMQWVLDNPDKRPDYQRRARRRIREVYSWDRITDQYEQLFFDLRDGKYPWRLFGKPVSENEAVRAFGCF